MTLGRPASPPCLAAEAGSEPLRDHDPQQALEVARWRRAERARLLATRQATPVAELRAVSEALARHLAPVIAARLGGGGVLSGYWPIRGEPDLRPLLAALHRAGATIALPLVETRAAPLAFRRWTPETRMVRGDWGIPVPPPGADRLVPDIALAPLVGWAQAEAGPGGWRLGYGGGYFDRTLAAAAPRPFAIGTGLAAARLATIFPQPHDIVLDLIVTEDGIRPPDPP